MSSKKDPAAMNGAQALRYYQNLVSTLRRSGMAKSEAVAQVAKETKAALPGLKVKQPVSYYDLGWRVGTVLSLPDKYCVKIKVLAPDRLAIDEKTGKPKMVPRPPVFVPIGDVFVIERCYLRRPWGTLSS